MSGLGDKQRIDYEFDTFLSSPGVYSVDVQVKDAATLHKKNLGGHRVIQYVDSSQPNTTAFFQGFFRAGSASVSGNAVDATLQLQLQQALLTPHLDIRYQLVDTFYGGSADER